MAEYCEYMWDSTRGHASPALARSIYEEEARFDKRDKSLAIKTVRAILRETPNVDLKVCTDEYIERFLLARKHRTEQTASLIAAYQAQRATRQDIFGNLTARDAALQRALRAGIPGVLPARDRRGRCVLVILASQWDPIAVPALAVERAIFLVLETLIQDPRNQKNGFVAVVDWSDFSLRQGSALGATVLRNLITSLRGRFPARFKAIHFLSAPLYVKATLAIVKPFLDEKTRNKIYLHGNNLSTLHQHLPIDILPAELGGIGPAFNPGLWAEPVIHTAMKEVELAVSRKDSESTRRTDYVTDESNARKSLASFESNRRGFARTHNARPDVEMDLISVTRNNTSMDKKKSSLEENTDLVATLRGSAEMNLNGADSRENLSDERTNLRDTDNQFNDVENSTFLGLQDELNANKYNIISNGLDNIG